MNNNTIYTQKSELDQFYTNPEIAKKCFEEIKNLYNINEFDLLLEPSAGSGSFYNLFPKHKSIGIDLDPKCKGVLKQDFFELTTTATNIITIGNPPFGKNSSLAVKFFNKAAEFSQVIAFIIPKTFKKKSIHNRLNLNFHLQFEKDIPKNSFILNDEPYDVPCCFQIWEKRRSKRKKIKFIIENDIFTFVKKEEDPDLAVRRVGGRTGKATKDIEYSAAVSHYFIKIKPNISVDWVEDIINSINFSKIINATAGVKSLSKPEFVKEIIKATK